MKALVTADLHLGYRMYGLKQRELDFYQAAFNAFDVAKAENVDAVFLAGDVFDTTRPPAAAVSALERCVRLHGVETFGIEGNHDLINTGEWLSVCGVKPIGTGSVYDKRVVGINYRRPKELLEALESTAAQCEDLGLRIPVVLLHTGFEDMGDPFAAELPTTAVMPFMKRIGCHTVCVGHIHKRMVKEVVLDGHKVTFIQPGSIEACSLSEERDMVFDDGRRVRGAKAVTIIEFDDERLISRYEVPLPTRVFKDVRIDTQDDLKKFLAEPDCEFDEKMTVARVKSSVDGAMSAVEQKLRGKLYRILAYNDKVELEEVDRSSQLITLESVIGEYFDEGSDVYELLRDVLKNPERAADIVEHYIKGDDNAPVSKLDA